MAYATKSDIENVFGSDSVEKWADLNNKRQAAEIRARINWALNLATTRVNSRLRGGPYEVPFSIPYDLIIVDLAARMAGVLLYQGRTTLETEVDSTTLIDRNRQAIDRDIRNILAGRLRLDLTQTSATFPQVIT